MIERFPVKVLQSNRRSDPVVMTDQRAMLECGCSGYVGFRTDKMEVVTVLRACSRRHERIVQVAQEALAEWFKHPTPRPLVEIVDELLVEAGKQVGSAAR